MKISSFLQYYNYLFGKRPLPLQKPTVIQFPVIDICNSKCQMCRIWENRKSDDITPEQLAIGLSNPLYSEVSSIGINGGEPTLRKDLPDLIEVLFKTLPKLKYISLITNAFKYRQVIDQIDSLGRIIKRNDGYFDVMISLDGFEEVHDTVRGKKGNFANAKHVIAHVKSNSLVDKVRIGCTVIKENVLQLHDLLDFCQENDLYIKYRIGIPHQRLYTKDLKDPYALTFQEKYELTEFLENLVIHYEKNEYQSFFYKSLIGQVMHGKNRRAGCDWQHRGATITSKGELLYCAVESPVISERIYNEDSFDSYFKGKPVLDKIYKDKCNSCLHDYTGVPPKDEVRRRLLRRLIQKLRLNRVKEKTDLGKKLVESYRSIKFKRQVSSLEKVACSQIKFTPKISNSVDIILCGWYGTETLGDKAILAGIIQAIHGSLVLEQRKVNFYLTSLHPYLSEMTKSQMEELRDVEILNVHAAINMVPNSSLVVFAGGPLMGLDNLAEMEAIFSVANKFHVKTLIAGCGVGPFGAEYQKRSIANILKMSNFRVYRDNKSKTYAESLGINVDDDIVAEDPAFTWLKSVSDHFGSISTKRKATEEKTLLLGLRDFPYLEYSRHYSRKKSIEIKNSYERTIVSSLLSLCALFPNLTIKPLPMCTNHFGGDDRWFYRRIFKSNQELNQRINPELLGEELKPLDYCKEFIDADALIGMRFHSLVFGVGLGLPAIALDYTLGKGKVNSLAEKFGIPVMSLETVSESFIVGNIKEILEAPKGRNPIESLQFTDAIEAARMNLLNFNHNQ